MVYPMTDDLVEALASTVPCVSVVDNYRRGFIDSVDSDQIDAITGLVKTLHNHGHSKLGYASWVYDVPTPWVYNRFGAFVQTLFQLELEFDQKNALNLKRTHPLTPDQVADEIVTAVERGVTAFVFAADHQAYQIVPLLTARGLRIPEDCSITGFDGIAPPAGQKQIATIRVPYDEIGRSAFHQLMHRISFPTSPRRHVLVDADLEMGASICRIN
ncbi:MAG: substrate-binding domain-containing protein [Verrucomicrobia bacterium]|nr:substrate-binding domain-containing protein [Verrucomicrobiota bacterium]